MIVALDTNVLLEIRNGQPRAGACAREIATRILSGDAVTISNVVYAELLGGAGATPAVLDPLLRTYRITRHRSLPSAVWEVAAVAHGGYAARRRASHAGEPRRILADFVVGAHAERYADALVTLDSRPLPPGVSHAAADRALKGCHSLLFGGPRLETGFARPLAFWAVEAQSVSASLPNSAAPRSRRPRRPGPGAG